MIEMMNRVLLILAMLFSASAANALQTRVYIEFIEKIAANTKTTIFNTGTKGSGNPIYRTQELACPNTNYALIYFTPASKAEATALDTAELAGFVQLYATIDPVVIFDPTTKTSFEIPVQTTLTKFPDDLNQPWTVKVATRVANATAIKP